ncbi:hypothetical protein [Halomonas borealis]|uniref:hypothetical protein n=1 Tax=Halomonas borealis TaxID=2508710 RepID=UPI0014451B15|nr:hypothetical protein [Halomonas borealis]
MYPKAGEAVIGRPGSLIVKLVIEPDVNGWMGESLTHDEVNAIGISNIVVDGKQLKSRQEP